MFPFHRIYGWIFKSFNIGEETRLINRLIDEKYDRVMIIKRSWIFALYLVWIPILLLVLSMTSIWIASTQMPAGTDILKWTIIIGNGLMTAILTISSIVYIIHFRAVHQHSDLIITDLKALRNELGRGDRYFISFFNWSLTNQFLLFFIMIAEIGLIFHHLDKLNEHFLILSIDFIIIIAEIYYLQQYRKRMMDLEMDFNVVVQGKIFFVNQTGVLSNTQVIESDKIKTIRSAFPGKLASFFNFGTIDILTEGDTAMLGALSMYFVTNPVKVVNSIQMLLGELRSIPPAMRSKIQSNNAVTRLDKDTTEKTNAHQTNNQQNADNSELIQLHAIDTRGKVRDIIEN